MRGLGKYNAQRDPNEPEIVEAAQKAGKFVTRVISSKPVGTPDLIVITPGIDVPVFVVRTVEQMLDVCALNEPIVLVEVKPEKQKLKDSQVYWHGKALGDKHDKD